MKPKTLILLTLLGVFGFFVITSFSNQVAGFGTFADATESERNTHVAGMWVEDPPMRYDPASNVFTFSMTDEAGVTQEVVYYDPKPANFEDAEKVVVEGKMEGGVFVAENILVKCPSKYNEQNEFQQAEPGTQPGVPTTPTSL
ncbi:MAG: cytochrome c maturation protein CcmE [Bacteroidota bacterium]